MKRKGCPPGKVLLGGVCVPKICVRCKKHWEGGDLESDRGYLLPDGSIIDMSGAYHDDILLPFRKQTFSDPCYDFQEECNAVRFWNKSMSADWVDFSEDTLIVTSVHKPTKQQQAVLTKMLLNARFITAEKIHSDEDKRCLYEPVKKVPWSIFNWVKKCWP